MILSRGGKKRVREPGRKSYWEINKDDSIRDFKITYRKRERERVCVCERVREGKIVEWKGLTEKREIRGPKKGGESTKKGGNRTPENWRRNWRRKTEYLGGRKKDETTCCRN